MVSLINEGVQTVSSLFMLKCTTIELIAPISAPHAYENWIILGIKFSDEEKKDLIKVNGDKVGEICIMLTFLHVLLEQYLSTRVH